MQLDKCIHIIICMLCSAPHIQPARPCPCPCPALPLPIPIALFPDARCFIVAQPLLRLQCPGLEQYHIPTHSIPLSAQLRNKRTHGRPYRYSPTLTLHRPGLCFFFSDSPRAQARSKRPGQRHRHINRHLHNHHRKTRPRPDIIECPSLE
jgi:hypothetical protein